MVHEFSHVIAIILTGNEWNGFIADLTNIVCMKTDVKYNDKDAIPIIMIAGSLGSIIFCSIVISISIKFKNLYLLSFSFLQVIGEFFYWGISPIIEFGDAYIMYTFLKFKNWQLLSISFFVMVVLLLILYAIIHYKIFLKKCGAYLAMNK